MDNRWDVMQIQWPSTDTQVVAWIYEGLGVDGKLYNKKGTCVLIR